MDRGGRKTGQLTIIMQVRSKGYCEGYCFFMGKVSLKKCYHTVTPFLAVVKAIRNKG